MDEVDQKISELEARLDRLIRTQIGFQTEVTAIRTELKRLRTAVGPDVEPDRVDRETSTSYPAAEEPAKFRPPTPPEGPRPRPPAFQSESSAPNSGSAYSTTSGTRAGSTGGAASRVFSKYSESARGDLEKFIGENLISKIGVLVLIIGLGIGVKYSIDNNLISPLTRVIIAYLFAFGLVGLAIYLKPRYLNFSAALISGGMATMYFVTYFAYTAYSLLGQVPAFGLMAMCTIFTVAAALFYNRQVIAHIGLVGAYAVPFLISSDSGNYLFLFIYMAVINAGILAISVQRYWRPLFYTSSGFTWLIFYSWYVSRYSPGEHFGLALVFLAIYFAIFLATGLMHMVVHAEHDDLENIIAAVATTFIFYGFCFAISANQPSDLQVWTLFTYLAAVTTVLLVISFRFVGKSLVYLAFISVWLTYGVWYLSRYNAEEHFTYAAVFAAVFFAVFYVTILAYRLASEDLSLVENAGLVLSNSFLFYGFGYSILNGSDQNSQYLGLYTAGHSAFHLALAHLVNRIRASAVDVVQVLTVLVLTFASIAIPVQFDGNQVTMIWSVEAAVLFWFGRSRLIRLFEYFSYPVMLLATGSMFLDWGVAYFNRTPYPSEGNLQPLANGNFITALVYIAAFAVIFAVSRDKENESPAGPALVRPFGYLIAGLAIFVLYNAFRLEISNYFYLRTAALDVPSLGVQPQIAANLFNFNVIWQINYTILFLAAMAFVNIRRVRSSTLAAANAGLGVAVLGLLATAGMLIFHDLRVGYMAGESGYGPLSIRYVSYAAAAALLLALYIYSRDNLLTDKLTAPVSLLIFEAVGYTFLFITASCELVNLMAQFGIPDGTKLGLSIFWGIYALLLIVLGIAWNKKYLRVTAIVLLAVTLIKLFFYDAAELDTIPRTILFVSLGLTLLVISFLYNKYKNAIFGLTEESEE